MELGINERIAARVRELRSRQGLSLEALAEATGVSRSMISLIERGESNPTAVLLEKLAVGLGVSLATLFELSAAPPRPLSRRADQVEWRDPESGYLRRNVSPDGFPSPIQIVEVLFPPGARVAYETAARPGLTHQQVWVLEGEIQLTLGEEHYHLGAGDCLAMVLDRPITYHNATQRTAHYCVVLVAPRPA